MPIDLRSVSPNPPKEIALISIWLIYGLLSAVTEGQTVKLIQSGHSMIFSQV